MSGKRLSQHAMRELGIAEDQIAQTRWSEADLFAALDAEGWFRGLSSAEAKRFASQLYRRLAGAIPIPSERPE